MPVEKHRSSRPAYALEGEIIKEELEDEIKRHVGAKSDADEDERDDRLHNTKLLLKKYRRVAYAVRIAEEELNLRMEMAHGTRLSTLEVNAELAGMDLSNTRLEGYTRSIVRSRNMLEIITSALESVRQDPDHGELMYQILYLTYFTPQKLRNRDCILTELEKAGFPLSATTYHVYLKAAIEAIDRILWGYTARDCMEIVKQFLPD
jgi:hypothetical protein